MLNLDFSSVPSREPLEEGTYALCISDTEEKVSNSGNPMLLVTFDVTDVDGNRKLFENFPLIPKALWKLKNLLDAVGMDTSEVMNLDPADLHGLELQAKVIQEEYNGDTVNRIKKFMEL